MHEVVLERHTERDLQKLSAPVFDRVIKAIKDLAGNPRPTGCHKIVGSENSWRIRVGDYRVIYEVDDRLREVKIMRARRRREAYR